MNDTFTRSISRILLIFFFMLAGFEGFAQYTKSTLATGGYYTAMTKDNSGNLYVVQYNAATTKYEVAKYVNGAGVPQIIYNNLVDASANNIYSWGLAVNSLGDVFVTDADQSSGWSIIKLTAPAYTPSVIHTGNFYSALAVDNSNNLLAMEYNGATATYQLVRYLFGSEELGGTPVWNGFTYPTAAIFPATYPSNIVVDSHDNIYLTDFHENSGGRIVKLTAPGFSASQLATGRGFSSLAVDASDNFYVTEATSDPDKYQLVKYTDLTQAGIPLYTGFHQVTGTFFPWGTAVMANGNIFANDGENGGEIVKLAPPTISVTNMTLGAANPTNATTVTYNVTFSGSAAAGTVTPAAFTLVTTGLTGGSITGVTGSGAGPYTVTVTPGSGSSGTAKLNVNGTGLSPALSAPYTTGPTYTIDRIVPTGSIVINGGAAYTNNVNVTLTLTGSDVSLPMQMAFSIDAGAYTTDETFATTKALTLPSTDGLRTVSVRLRDAAGNTSFYSASITLDRTAPNTQITASPALNASSTNATFQFSSNESPVTYQGQLDAGPYVMVSSPQTYTGLADGPHTFRVRAVDPAGNIDSSPDIYTWVVDATGPVITHVSVPAPEYYHAGQVLEFKLQYNEQAIVDNTTGNPYINILIGPDAKQVPYVGGSGTNELTFQYVVQQGEMDLDGIQVQPLVQNNSGTIQDVLGNNASTSLSGIDPTTAVRVNTSIPSVSLSFAAGVTMPTNAPFTVQAVFSEPVSGLSVADFNVLNTTVSALSTSDNITYTALMTPASDGVRSISLPANVAENIGHNPNTPSNVLTYTYDATAPTVTSVTVPANKYYREGETMSFTVNFSENIILNTTGGLPALGLTIGTANVNAAFISSTATSITFVYTVANGDMDMDGVAVTTLSLNGSTIRDAATNNAILTLNNIDPTANVRVNTAHPSVTITSAAPAVVNAPFNATVTFSEAVTSFAPTDIVVTNGIVQGFTQISGTTYNIQVAPTAEGTVTVNVPANVADNIGLNGNTASAPFSRIYDTAPPAVTAVSVPMNGFYKAGDVMNLTVRYSENIILNTTGGNPVLSLIIGTDLVNTTFTGTNGTDGLDFSYTVVDGQMDMDGIEVGDLVLNGATIFDAANNPAFLDLHGVDPTTGIFVNTQHPTVSLSSSASAKVNAAFTVNVTFSEAVTGLTAADFTVTNGTASALTGSNAAYTVVVTPAADGPVSINLPADVAFNIGDNGNTASNTLNRDYDGTAPKVTGVAVPVNDYYNAGSTLDFIVRFDQDLIINTTGGNPTLELNIGGTIVNATYTGANGTDGLNFSYTVLNGQMDMDGIQIVALNAAGSTIRDDADNDADLTLQNVGNTTFVRVNTTHPTVAISTTSAPSVNTPFTVNIAFSENVTGFTSADVAVTNATVSPITVIDNANYVITIIPTANGPVTVNIPADVAENIGHNGNTASNTLNLTYDINQPTVTSVSVPAPKYYRAGETLTFTVHYDEDVILNLTGGSPYISIEIGSTLVNAVYTGSTTAHDLEFSYTVVSGDMDLNGILVNVLELNGSTIKDAANNDANLVLYNTGNTSGVRVNTTDPSVALTTTASPLVNAPFTVTATFSEAVTILTESDFSVTNGTLSGLSSTDNITYTVTVTPTSDGAVSVQIPANGVVNIGGNGNTASNTINVTYDGTKPQVNAVFVPINGYYKAGDVMNFIVFFDENININTAGGVPYLNVVLGSGTVRAAYTVATANSLSFSYTVQPGDMDLDGITVGTLNLNGGTIKDDATNDADLTVRNVANTSQVFVHTGSPSVQLSTTAAARVNAPFTVNVVFNEEVTGLTAGDFTITNGTAATLSTSDNITYTIVVTPAADGPVTVQLPAGQAQNVVSNNNTASNTLTVTYDATSPVVDGGLSFQVLERSAVGTLVGKATATDASGIFQNWTIASDDSNGAFSIDANGNIQVADQAKLNAKVGTTVNLTVTVGDGLNTSIAAPVTIEVIMVNQSPTLNAISDVTICPDGQPHTIQTEGASAVEPGQTYGFNIITNNPGNFDQLSISATGLITYQLKTTATGTSTVTVTIKDDGGIANGGTDTLRRSFSINVATLGTVTITSDKGNSISKGDIVRLTATGGATYEWDNADGILSGQQSDVLEARPMQNTTYRVTARSAAGCTNTAEFTVSIVADFKVDATNMLTPNGDGKNDKWVIRNLDSYPNNEVTIFDRSGRMVYTRKNYSNDWDGTMNGSPLAEGTYYYILTIEGGAKTAKGFITIIRDRN